MATIQYVEDYFSKRREAGLPSKPLYAEIGRYKGFSASVIKAAEKRGYRVVQLLRGVYEIYDKGC